MSFAAFQILNIIFYNGV